MKMTPAPAKNSLSASISKMTHVKSKTLYYMKAMDKLVSATPLATYTMPPYTALALTTLSPSSTVVTLLSPLHTWSPDHARHVGATCSFCDSSSSNHVQFNVMLPNPFTSACDTCFNKKSLF